MGLASSKKSIKNNIRKVRIRKREIRKREIRKREIRKEETKRENATSPSKMLRMLISTKWFQMKKMLKMKLGSLASSKKSIKNIKRKVKIRKREIRKREIRKREIRKREENAN